MSVDQNKMKKEKPVSSNGDLNQDKPEKVEAEESTKKDISDFVGVPVSTPTSFESPAYISSNLERSIPDANLPTEYVEGILDIANEGSGLLRPRFAASDKDIYISASQIRRFNLRVGDKVGGQARRPKENERYWGLLKVEKVNGVPVESLGDRANFDDLLAIYPDEQIVLSTEKDLLTTRVIDLMSPVGFGQRGLVVSPPKAGKTWLLKDIIAGIAKNYPENGKQVNRRTDEPENRKTDKPKNRKTDELSEMGSSAVKQLRGSAVHKGVHLMAVLIGERPEEVTDIVRHMSAATNGFGDVAASNFDEAPENQTRVGELALERAKRLVETGQDVVVVLDSITRMARAYNLALPTSGRTLSGGFDPVALFPAKKFFGAARKIENAGSLTIIGTCLVDTGSRMDDLIYEEFKGTGNMELHLDRKLADRRIFPAIDVTRSGTRQEELLYEKEILPKIHTLRRMLDLVSETERTETVLERLRKTEDNKEFLNSLKTV
jgi:transcription termination factor Rho